MKNGRIAKNPIIGGSNGLPPLKNVKKKVIKKKIRQDNQYFFIVRIWILSKNANISLIIVNGYRDNRHT